eukprot:Blabericola_migrator_1__8099@NODE_416_length_8706_cov_42_211136_g328_i0_p5_GENE_NODE_416_length_8706_cov_42_211136_g328_i0NODE_416_length_8706_cov_42_211136_g328_i0_p5_ORF_typecomplete_len174_score16_75CobD_Cbib/PF03186_13/0_25_NODE_416_length_8706_cov_42_211136_g328_i05971118
MPAFGNTGKWLILPVTLCVGFVGAYLIFSELQSVVARIFLDNEFRMRANGVADFFAADPPTHFLDQFPSLELTPAIPWLASLVNGQSTLLCLTGVWSVLALICPFAFMAKGLVYLGSAYGLVWFITHLAIFYCFREQLLLQCSPEYRGVETKAHFLFGEYRYPESFWYTYFAQ